jgi:hypothetical protein
MITPESQAQSWGVQPRRFAWPGELAGMSLAVFGENLSQPLVLSAPADPDSNVLTVSLSEHAVDMDVDGRGVHRGLAGRGASMLLRPGERPVASIGGSWRIAQYYLPDALLSEIASDLQLPQVSLANLLGPRFSVDGRLLDFSSRMLSRLAMNVPMSRLELDEFGLMLIEHLLVCYLPGQARPWSGRAPPRLGTLLEEYLRSGEDGGIHGFAKGNDFAVGDVLWAIRRRRGTPA